MANVDAGLSCQPRHGDAGVTAQPLDVLNELRSRARRGSSRGSRLSLRRWHVAIEAVLPYLPLITPAAAEALVSKPKARCAALAA
jgi:hypothetical protein